MSLTKTFNRCDYLYFKGGRKNTLCNCFCLNGSNRCSVHKKSELAKQCKKNGCDNSTRSKYGYCQNHLQDLRSLSYWVKNHPGVPVDQTVVLPMQTEVDEKLLPPVIDPMQEIVNNLVKENDSKAIQK